MSPFRTTQSEKRRDSILRRTMTLNLHISPQVQRRTTLLRKAKRSPLIFPAKAVPVLLRHPRNLLEALPVSPFFHPRPKPQVEDSYGFQTSMLRLNNWISERTIAIGPERPFAFYTSSKGQSPLLWGKRHHVQIDPVRRSQQASTKLHKTSSHLLPLKRHPVSLPSYCIFYRVFALAFSMAQNQKWEEYIDRWS